MTSKDKTSDLLVATTRATQAESGADATAGEAKPAEKTAQQKPVSKKTATKKAAAKKKVVAKKAAPKKAPVSKAEPKTQKEQLLSTFTVGRRVWPD